MFGPCLVMLYFLLSSGCHVAVIILYLFLMIPWVDSKRVMAACPGHSFQSIAQHTKSLPVDSKYADWYESCCFVEITVTQLAFYCFSSWKSKRYTNNSIIPHPSVSLSLCSSV